MTAVTVWTASWSDLPFLDPVECKHPGAVTLSLGVRIDRSVRGRPRISSNAVFCMQCGIDTSGKLPPEEALQAAWTECGWHPATRERLLDLAARPLPSFPGIEDRS